MAIDEVSGIEAPVVVRTLRASGPGPVMILLGDKPARAERPELLDKAFQADAEKLFMVLYRTLPGCTIHRLLREMLRAWAGDKLSLSGARPVISDVKDVLYHLDAELSR